jgi:hypothetical protein
VAKAVEMIFVRGRQVIYGRKTAARTDGLIDNRIGAKTGRPTGGKIAGRMRMVSSVGWIELIEWLANMDEKGETMPVRYKWIDQTGRRVLSDHNGRSGQNGHKAQSVRREPNDPDATNLTSARRLDSASGAESLSAPPPFELRFHARMVESVTRFQLCFLNEPYRGVDFAIQRRTARSCVVRNEMRAEKKAATGSVVRLGQALERA